MLNHKKAHSPSVIEAIILIMIIVGLMSISLMKYSAAPHIPILLSILMLISYGLMKKVPFKILEEGMVNGAKSGLSAVFLFS